MKYNIVCHGNSLTLGATQTPYPSQLDTLLGGSHVVLNGSAGAVDTQHLVDNFATEVHNHYDAVADVNIVIMWEITNALRAGQTVAAEKARVIEYCEIARSNGWLVILGNVIRRGSYPVLTVEEWNARVTEINAWLETSWPSLAHGFCNFHDLNSIFSTPFEGNGDPTYYIDLSHLNTAGYALIAAEAEDAVDYAVSVRNAYEVTLPDTTTRIIPARRLKGGKIATIYDGSSPHSYQGEPPVLIPTPSKIISYASGG